MKYPSKERISKVLEKIEKRKIKPTRLISKNATPVEKVKFNICQLIIKYKRNHDYLNKDVAEIINVTPAVISRIVHCQIDKFSIESLLNYYYCLLLSSKDKRSLKRFDTYLEKFLKDMAA